MYIMKSETLLHILSLLTNENLKKTNDPSNLQGIEFPFDLMMFCFENDLKLKKLRERHES